MASCGYIVNLETDGAPRKHDVGKTMGGSQTHEEMDLIIDFSDHLSSPAQRANRRPEVPVTSVAPVA